MAVDWREVSRALHTEVAEAIHTACAERAGAVPGCVEIIDLHLRDMLVLWPSVRVCFRSATIAPVVIEGSRRGDRLAAQITALGGPGGTPWTELFAAFDAVVVAAFTAAATATGIGVCVGGRDDDTATPIADPPPIENYVASDGPLSYDALIDVLVRAPHLDSVLATTVDVGSVRPIDAADVSTAVGALSSPYESVRRHATVVLLSVHL